MKKIYSSLLLMLVSVVTFSQIAITSNGIPFTENFNSLASTGATNAITTLPSGWTFLETGTNANTTYAADNGGLNGGNTYSFGTTSATERSFGGIQSGTVIPTIGASYINNTGGIINTLAISYTGEQWRIGVLARVDRLDFSYSTDATSLTVGTYTGVSALNFTAPVTTGTVGALDGNATANKTAIAFTITGLSIANGTTFWIRWNDFNATGADDGLAIDDFSITATGSGGADVTPPTVSTLTPLDNATNVNTNTNLQVVFNEPIIKGTGNILVKKVSDNTTVQTIDVNTGAVVIAPGTTATITISPLLNATDYYIEVTAGAFTDIALNDFAGISGNTTWNFTTLPAPAAGIIGNNYTFTNCTTTFINEGWSQYSVTGAATWSCSTTGRTDAFGVQMNAFIATNNNPLNEDWLISPAFNLTAASSPALRFYSRGDFVGNSLQLRASTNYVYGTDPNTATWTTLNGDFPANVTGTGVFKLSDNIDLSAFNTSNVRLAWVYVNPTTANSSRWTIDDVTVFTNVVLPPCSEPADQPTNLVLNATAASVTGSFNLIPSPTSIQNYLVVRSLTTPLSVLPTDGTTYNAGQIIGGGNGTVVGVSTDGNFTDNAVTAGTQYYYFIFAIEDQGCAGGPNYNQTAPLTTVVTTPALAPCTTPTAPTGLVLTPANTSISGTFNTSGANKYITVISTVAPPLGGSPSNGIVYTNGQPIGNGTVVSYSSTNSFAATGLTVATPYYFYVFAANDACTGTPFYSTTSLNGTVNTTNNSTGIPTGYYNAAAGLNCQALKSALKTIVTNGSDVLSYTPGLWNLYQFSDIHRNDANTADIIWDMYSDNPTGPEPYTYTYGTNQCGSGGNSVEGDCYNREHSTPQSWFQSVPPMVSDAHHIFPTDKVVNGNRSNFPYGEVTNATITSLNGSKLGTGTNFGYSGTIFEPINEYKGDFARACLYMATRYEDEIISQNWYANGSANALFLSPTDETDPAKRRLQIYDAWQLKTLVKWHNQDPVSQKEIDRNNAIYYTSVNTTTSGTPKTQANRNPFIDHPEYVAAIFNCTGLLPVTLTDFFAQKNNESVTLKWLVENESAFEKYVVERSIDGRLFNYIGEINSANLSTYNFEDKNLPNVTVVYYRLKLIDADAKFSYSKIVSVRLKNNASTALVYPNPAVDVLNVRLYEPLFTNSTVQIFDVTGILVKQQAVITNAINLNIDVKNLAAGSYFMKIKNSRQLINQSFVIFK